VIFGELVRVSDTKMLRLWLYLLLDCRGDKSCPECTCANN
jgi:hypothetical protein